MVVHRLELRNVEFCDNQILKIDCIPESFPKDKQSFANDLSAMLDGLKVEVNTESLLAPLLTCFDESYYKWSYASETPLEEEKKEEVSSLKTTSFQSLADSQKQFGRNSGS